MTRPPPSPQTKPSRFASKGRDAFVGSSVPRGHRLHLAEAAMVSGDDDRLGAARDHDVGVAALNDLHGVADA